MCFLHIRKWSFVLLAPFVLRHLCIITKSNEKRSNIQLKQQTKGSKKGKNDGLIYLPPVNVHMENQFRYCADLSTFSQDVEIECRLLILKSFLMSANPFSSFLPSTAPVDSSILESFRWRAASQANVFKTRCNMAAV